MISYYTAPFGTDSRKLYKIGVSLAAKQEKLRSIRLWRVNGAVLIAYATDRKP